MTRKNNNLYASEVYRELERQAIRKGFFTPTDSDIVKNAAVNVKNTNLENTVLNESGNLLQDIAILTSELRKKGLDTYAENIEQNLLIYKQAETLYNIEIDTAKNLAEFAHREGDVQIVGGGDLGVVETIQSAADKILAVIKKEPTGQYPKKTALTHIATLIKNAQAADAGLPEFETEVSKAADADPVVVSRVELIQSDLKNLIIELNKVQNFNFEGLLNADGTSTKRYFIGNGLLIQLFQKLGGNYLPLFEYGTMFTNAYHGQPQSPETIENILLAYIKNNDFKSANVYLENITRGTKHQTYHLDVSKLANIVHLSKIANPMGMPAGTQEAIQQSKQQEVEQDIITKTNTAIKQLAQKIYANIKMAFTTALDEVNKVTTKLKKYQDYTKGLVSKLETYANEKLTNAQSYNLYILKLNTHLKTLPKNIALIKDLFIGFNDQKTISNIDTLMSTISDNVNSTTKILISRVTDPVNQDQIKNILNILQGLDSRLAKAMDKYDELLKHKTSQKNIRDMINTINTTYLAGTAQLLKSLSYIGKYKSIEELEKDIQNVQTFINNSISKAEVKGGE